MGKALPIFDSLGEVVGATRNLLPSTEINTNGNVNKESKVNEIRIVHKEMELNLQQIKWGKKCIYRCTMCKMK